MLFIIITCCSDPKPARGNVSNNGINSTFLSTHIFISSCILKLFLCTVDAGFGSEMIYIYKSILLDKRRSCQIMHMEWLALHFIVNNISNSNNKTKRPQTIYNIEETVAVEEKKNELYLHLRNRSTAMTLVATLYDMKKKKQACMSEPHSLSVESDYLTKFYFTWYSVCHTYIYM